MPPRSTRSKARAADPEPELEQAPQDVIERSGGGTSNESPTLPASAVSGAARSHAMLEHAGQALADGDTGRAAAIIKLAQDELDRYLPPAVKQAGIPEAAQVVATAEL